MSLLARLRRVAERQVRGGNGKSDGSDAAVDVLTELPSILGILGAAVAFALRRRKRRG